MHQKTEKGMMIEKSHFVLTAEQWDEFVKMLDQLPANNPGLDRLMNNSDVGKAMSLEPPRPISLRDNLDGFFELK